MIDVIGDVHGCLRELKALLDHLGYNKNKGRWSHDSNRQIWFLGDLIDRGPYSIETLGLVEELVCDDVGKIASIGNHDWRIWRYLCYKEAPDRWGGLKEVLLQAEGESLANPGIFSQLEETCEYLFSQAPAFSKYKNLIVVHAAIRPKHLPLANQPALLVLSEVFRNGETSGDLDSEGRTVRTFQWIDEWRNLSDTVVFGHNVCGNRPHQYGKVINIDTGCAFGGTLTAYRWPEGEAISVQPSCRYSYEHPVMVAGDLQYNLLDRCNLISV